MTRVDRLAASQLSRTLRGRPPFFPFRRAASALAALLTLPPLRPRATAAGFLRAMWRQRFQTSHERGVVGQFSAGDVGIVRPAVRFAAGEGGTFLGEMVFRRSESVGLCVGRHAQDITKPLGFCQGLLP